MRPWIVTALVAIYLPAAPGQVYEVFKDAEINARLENLEHPTIIYPGANFAISLHAQTGVTGGIESDGEVDELLSIRTGSGALVVGESQYKVRVARRYRVRQSPLLW
jgi:hypothetical protein